MKEDVTRIINAIERGDAHASEELLPLVYQELRNLAAKKMAGERADHTLQPTALVHEAYMRLLGPDGEDRGWDGRAHFFSSAAEAMRRILIDQARRKHRVRHGGEWHRTELKSAEIEASTPEDHLMAIDEALEELAQVAPEKAQVVKLRFFVGFTASETAEALGISLSTVERYWRYSKAWLLKQMESSPEG